MFFIDRIWNKLKNRLRIYPFFPYLKIFKQKILRIKIKLIHKLNEKRKASLKKSRNPYCITGVHDSTEEYVKNGPKRKKDKTITLFQAHKLNQTLPTAYNRLHKKYKLAAELNIPASNVYILHNTRYLGTKDLGGIYISADNRILNDLSHMHGNVVEETLKINQFPPIKRLKGTVVALSVALGSIYGHWICELIPRILLMKKAGFTSANVDHYIISHNNAPYQIETLRLLGIPEHKIIIETADTHLMCKKLVAASLTLGSYSSPAKTYYLMNYPRWARSIFPEETLKEQNNNKWPGRIYLSRRHCSHRRIINEKELLILLNDFNFKEIIPEQLSFQKQRELFANTRVIVSPQGSTLANIVFCQPGTSVIQIHSPRYVNTVYWSVSRTMNLRFFPLMGVDEASDEILDDDIIVDPNNNYADITADLKALRALLIDICGNDRPV